MTEVEPPSVEGGGEGGWLCKHTQLLMPTLDTAPTQKYTRKSVLRDTDPFLSRMYTNIEMRHSCATGFSVLIQL